MKLSNYLSGSWIDGNGVGIELTDPITGDQLVTVDSDGVDIGSGMSYARQIGNAELQKLSYGKRAKMLEQIARILSEQKQIYYEIAQKNYGATVADAAFDIDGAIYTLKSFARAGQALGDNYLLFEGRSIPLAKTECFQGQHYLKPVAGVAVFINAFNFPSWGLWEKAAPALLSGVPVLVKPATPTAWLTQRMIADVVKAGIVPNGALNVICGPARDLLDHVECNDVVSFTGSAQTAQYIRNHPRVISESVRVNIEADSVNSAVVGPDVTPQSETFNLAVREIVKELTTKAGQKCTAIRRIFVPVERADDLAEAIKEKLGKVKVGDPREEGVRMGPLVNRSQRDAALMGINQLQQNAQIIFGEEYLSSTSESTGNAIFPPVVLVCDDGQKADIAHDIEVFGPVATIFPYNDNKGLVDMLQKGKGSLVVSVYSDDSRFLTNFIPAVADFHGRVMVVDKNIGDQHTGHGNVMPNCLHGGPGRAGGGEELGGLRGLLFYHRRYVVQAGPELLSSLSNGAADASLLYT